MEAVYTYTRQNAIDDGVLVNVSEMATEAGFRYPVAITERLNNHIENIPEEYSHEDYFGRLWDVLLMGMMNIKRAMKYRQESPIVLYDLISHSKGQEHEDLTTLKIMVHGGDNGEPAMTIMFPDED